MNVLTKQSSVSDDAKSSDIKVTIKNLLKKSGVSGDRKIGEVMETFDYDQFKFLDLNRTPDESNIKAIMASMRNYAIPIPIIVNEHREIIDGQHTFFARKNLNLPIIYLQIDGLNIDHVPLFQTGRPWKDHDWLKLWIGKGNEHYSIYNKFRQQHKLGHWTVVGLLFGNEYAAGQNRVTLWRDGEFRVNYLKQAEDLMEKVARVKNNLDKKLINDKGQVTRNFIYGLQRAILNTKFNFDRFADNMTKPNAPKIENWGDEESFRNNIFAVFNFGLPVDKQIKLS